MPLNRSLKYFSLTNIVVGDMIGAGIFIITGIFLAALYNPIIMIGLWVIGGCIALCGALSYSELGASFPKAGGEYVFLSELFTPVLGFLSGWVSFIVGFSAPIAAVALSFSEYGLRAVADGTMPEHIVYYKKGVAIAIILLFTIIHSLGLKSGSKFHNLLTILKIVIITGFITSGFIFGDGSFNNFIVENKEVFNLGHIKTLGLALMVIMYSYSGWNATTYIGSEVINPVKNIPRSLITGTAIVALLYILMNILYVYAIPADKMKDVVSIGGLAANYMFNLSLDKLFSIFIAIILLSSISACIVIGPRVYYAMSKGGHFFPMASKVNRYNVPAISIVFQSCVSIAFVIFSSLHQIIVILSFSLGIFPILAVIGVFKLRIKKLSKFRSPGYPYVQILFIMFSLTILVLAYMEMPKESSIALFITGMGVPLYYLLGRNKFNKTQRKKNMST